MKTLKSMKDFVKGVSPLTKNQLNNVIGGNDIRYDVSCDRASGCDDRDEMHNDYNPTTGLWSGWYLFKRRLTLSDC
ncbi:MAG: bacteriocin [Flavobacterium sp.]|uniref:bacteriocin n=1 Tax=Flavobacterium sp. TaxID=239 RepID=UPI003266D0A1